ncbi:uncharacterized protein ACRADG_001924 isoform 2-T2 [Cochliomyia hominivorax]
MIFIKKFQLFVIFALSLMEYTKARYMSVSQMGDVRIERSDDKWLCDQIECPLDADRCVVTKSNENDPAVLVRTNICYSKDNKKLEEKVTTSAVDTNSNINMNLVSYAHGGTTIVGGDGNFDSKKFQEDLDRNLGHMQANLDDEMNNLQVNLNNMHENINRNLENQMKQLEENLNYD